MTTPATDRASVLDPLTLAKVANLSLKARLVVEGVLSGLHKSPHHGSSVEFAEHKEYSPGDDTRHIDWKVYAKSDRYTVKRFEEETNLKATLVLDASASMLYQGSGVSKWEYAVTLAASLGYLMLRQSDAVGLALVSGAGTSFVPPRSNSGHLKALLDALERARPAGRVALGPALETLAGRLRRRGLVMVVSDALDELPPLLRALAHLRHQRHEVILFQVLDRDEIEFPFEGLTLFASLEDEREVLSDPVVVRRDYLARLAAHEATLERALRAHEIDRVRLVTSTPLDKALVAYLAAR